MKFSNLFLALLLIILVVAFSGCESETDDSPPRSNISIERISGVVQKGPYVNGTSIQMSELNQSLDQTGLNFNSQITDNLGSFLFNDLTLSSSIVEFSASGFYFNEVKGEISSSQLRLNALSDINDLTSVNVNILTHLEKRRVMALIREGETFDTAKKMAQKEILAIFGIEKGNMSSSESLNITINNEDNGILLAISSILQGDRSVGDLTEILAVIAGDLEQDGILDNEAIISNLRASAANLNVSQILLHLKERYNSLGLEASVPNFQPYLDTFLEITATKPEIINRDPLEILAHSSKLQSLINPNSSGTHVFLEFGKTSEYGNEISSTTNPLQGSDFILITKNLENLDPATEYFYRFRAENVNGTIFGEESNFTTLGKVPEIVNVQISEIKTRSLIIKSEIKVNDLITTVTAQYRQANTFHDLDSKVLDASGEGFNPMEISGLMPGEKYFIRLKAENQLGAVVSEPIEIIMAGEPPYFPHVYFYEPTANSLYVDYWIETNLLPTKITVVYSTLSNLENAVEIIVNEIPGSIGMNVFNHKVENLEIGQEYFFMLKSENELGKDESAIVKFKMKDGKVVFKTLGLDSTHYYPTYIEIPAKIFTDGGLPVLEMGLVYSKTPNPTVEVGTISNKVENPNHEYLYSNDYPRLHWSSLDKGTIYYIRAYAINETGLFYDKVFEFKTPD